MATSVADRGAIFNIAEVLLYQPNTMRYSLIPLVVALAAVRVLGGITLATALSMRTGKPCLYVRKAAKPYGTSNLVEGGYPEGTRALVVEDVITSGGQVCISVGQMRGLGFIVEDVVCVIDREQGGREAIEKIGCRLRSLFTLAELEALAG